MSRVNLADTVLLEVRKELLALSTVEDCKF